MNILNCIYRRWDDIMKALIAMSGGVDSSVAAFLTQKQGYECVGCTMKLYNNEDAGISRSHTCCSLEDVEDARSVAYRLGMNYFVFNFSDDFKEKIMQKFADSYARGITPNPCIDCNKYMKFDKLFERAEIMGCKYIVTGHYARIGYEDGKYVLKKAADDTKDQSYVLYSMTQDQLSKTLFPLGDLPKSEVRHIAEENGFLNFNKPDSQDICFVPDGNYAGFVEKFAGCKFSQGNFTDIYGNVIGTHKGIIHYTIGQRKGLGISAGRPLYVTRINADSNEVTLGGNEDLYSREVHVSEFNWISGEAPDKPVKCRAKIRYRQTEQPATAYPLENGDVFIVFDEPQRAVTKGQAAVLYYGDVVAGGGVIV